MLTSKSWLQQKHITVPNDWLEACIEWVKEEHGAVSEKDLHELIYEQWLMVDLHELQGKCLPDGLGKQSKFTLTGYFALQIDYLLDVSDSCYSQYIKLKGQQNENVTVSGEQSFQPTWKPKPKRMLMLTLTDGTQNIRAMEYKPISTLNIQTPPGTKILVYGEIVCRLGILLLTDSTVKVLGGEAENLLEDNTPLRIVSRVLGKYPESDASRTVTGIHALEDQNMASVSSPSAVAVQSVSHYIKSSSFENNAKTDIASLPSSVSGSVSVSEIIKKRALNNDGIPVTNSRTPTLENEHFDFPDDDLFMEMEDEIQNLEEIVLTQSTSDVTAINVKPKNLQDMRDPLDNFSDSILNAFKKPKEVDSDEQPLKKELSNSSLLRNTKLEIDRSKKKQTTLLTWSQKPNRDSVNFEPILNVADYKSSSARDRVFSYPLSSDDLDLASFLQSRSDTDTAKKLLLKSGGSSVWRKPYGYIADLLTKSISPSTKLTVNGFISTLTSPLQTSNGTWLLSAKINDGTGSLDVFVDNKVLEKLIGFKASDVTSFKLKAQHSPHVKQQFKECMNLCKHSLINLCGLLTIQMKSSESKPVIIEWEPIAKDCLEKLANRVKLFEDT